MFFWKAAFSNFKRNFIVYMGAAILLGLLNGFYGLTIAIPADDWRTHSGHEYDSEYEVTISRNVDLLNHYLGRL